MGLYDRDYGRNDSTPWDRMQNPRSITITLIIINVAIFVLQMLFLKDAVGPSGERLGEFSQLAEWGGVSGQTLIRPWLWWQFLSYGFLHDFRSFNHILFNMIGLFFFGRIVEQRIGRMEFLRFYLVAIVAGGVVGAVSNLIASQVSGAADIKTIGASGAVVATVILFACYFPHQQIYLMMVLPIKAWVAAILFVAMDLAGALGLMAGMGGSNVAFTVHLAGAGFALAYFFLHWNLRWLAPTALVDLPNTLRNRAKRTRLKIHDPDKKLVKEAEEADRILAKIHASGESSLTASERKTLQRYSRRQREKREL